MAQLNLIPTEPDTADPRVAAAPPMQRLRSFTAHRLARLVDTVTPPVCLACHDPLSTHDTICPACWTKIDFIRAPLCERLGIPLPYDSGAGTLSAQAVAAPPVYGRARAVARYDGVMRQLIHDFKFRDRQDARKLFGRWLAETGKILVADADVAVPIPLHRWKLLKRRFNQSAILSAELSRLTGLPNAPLALKRFRRTPPQLGLTAAQREQNVKGAFTVSPRHRATIDGRHVLLIDDVITTGATITAATTALLSAGATGVDVLSLALVTDTTSALDA